MGAFEKMTGGFMKQLKQKVTDAMLDYFGVSPDPKAFMRQVMNHFMAKVTVVELKDFIIGSTKCINASGKFAEAVVSTFVEKLPKMIGIEEKGPMATGLVKAVGDAFSKDFAQQLALAICKIDFRPLVKSIPGVGGMLAKFIGAPAYEKGDSVADVKADLKAQGAGGGAKPDVVASAAVELAAKKLEDKGDKKGAEEVRDVAAS